VDFKAALVEGFASRDHIESSPVEGTVSFETLRTIAAVSDSTMIENSAAD
jgi:hypothetical protein